MTARRVGAAALGVLSAACGSPETSRAAASASAVAAAPSTSAPPVHPTPAPSGSAPAQWPVRSACAFDWVDLREAFDACAVFGEAPSAWVPSVRTRPDPLRATSGEEFPLTVGLGREGSGPWVAELDDRCGTAMQPAIVDAQGQRVDDLALLAPPICPSTRASVALSPRGEITAAFRLKAVRRFREREIVGHRTAPGGRVEDVVEWKVREAPLAPGTYAVELALPMSEPSVVMVPLTVTAPSHPR